MAIGFWKKTMPQGAKFLIDHGDDAIVFEDTGAFAQTQRQIRRVMKRGIESNAVNHAVGQRQMGHAFQNALEMHAVGVKKKISVAEPVEFGVVDIESDDIGAALGEQAAAPAGAGADVEDPHAGADVDLVDQSREVRPEMGRVRPEIGKGFGKLGDDLRVGQPGVAMIGGILVMDLLLDQLMVKAGAEAQNAFAHLEEVALAGANEVRLADLALVLRQRGGAERGAAFGAT